jgi:hypothetical protein
MGRDIVYYGKRGESGIMCAGMSMCDAVIIADTPGELLEVAQLYKGNSLQGLEEAPLEEIVPFPITWHTLTSEWRWVIYQGKARFVIGGIDFCATAITNTPSRESALTADPSTVAYVGTDDNHEYITHDGCIIIGQDVPDFLMQLQAANGQDTELSHIMCVPFMTIAKDDLDVWYNRIRHSVREALEKNPVLLLGAFSDLSMDEISANSELIIEKLKEHSIDNTGEKTDEN